MRTRKSKSAPVGVIGKVLRILELLDRSPHGLQLREISAKTGMNKSTVHRFLSHLEAGGYLFRDAAGTYMLGPKLARMGSGVTFHTTLCKICRPSLENLRAATDETVNLAVLDGFEILYLERAREPKQLPARFSGWGAALGSLHGPGKGHLGQPGGWATSRRDPLRHQTRLLYS
jgi:DNA-binding IclR family transcriptional regulator